MYAGGPSPRYRADSRRRDSVPFSPFPPPERFDRRRSRSPMRYPPEPMPFEVMRPNEYLDQPMREIPGMPPRMEPRPYERSPQFPGRGRPPFGPPEPRPMGMNQMREAMNAPDMLPPQRRQYESRQADRSPTRYEKPIDMDRRDGAVRPPLGRYPGGREEFMPSTFRYPGGGRDEFPPPPPGRYPSSEREEFLPPGRHAIGPNGRNDFAPPPNRFPVNGRDEVPPMAPPVPQEYPIPPGRGGDPNMRGPRGYRLEERFMGPPPGRDFGPREPRLPARRRSPGGFDYRTVPKPNFQNRGGNWYRSTTPDRWN